jgi:hypothetical protein
MTAVQYTDLAWRRSQVLWRRLQAHAADRRAFEKSVVEIGGFERLGGDLGALVERSAGAVDWAARQGARGAGEEAEN